MIIRRGICGHSSLVEYQLPKLRRRVRFPLSAPFESMRVTATLIFCIRIEHLLLSKLHE